MIPMMKQEEAEAGPGPGVMTGVERGETRRLFCIFTGPSFGEEELSEL